MQDARAASAATMGPLETQLQSRGLEVVGPCSQLSARGASLLHESALLEDMTEREINVLGDAMVLVRAAPGQVLINEGEIGDWMLLLLSGTIDVTKRVPQPAGEVAAAADTGEPREEMTRLGVLRYGATLGEMSMLDSEPRFATCTAIDAVEAAVLDRRAVAHLIRQQPGVGAKLLVKLTQLMAQRLRNTSNRLVKLLHP